MAKQNKKTNPGKGYKQCPSCESKGEPSWVKGGRTAACPDCGHTFVAKTSRAPSSSGGQDREKLAAMFVLLDNAGNIDKALKAVEAYQADKVAAFIQSSGGADKAASALKALADKAGK